MSHPFGDLIKKHLSRKHGLSQSKLAMGIDQDPTVVAKMCKGDRLTGKQARERVIRIICWFFEKGLLFTVDEATALLNAAGMTGLLESNNYEKSLLEKLKQEGPVTSGQRTGLVLKKVPLQRPYRSKHFTGRTVELAKLIEDLKPGNVVSLCGPGGIGKSTLAIEALWHLAPDDEAPRDFPDGIVFHCFYNQPQVSLALEHIVRSFGEAVEPAPIPAALRILSDRQALIVLDGTEVADNLKTILEIRGKCAVLLTSRQQGDAPGVPEEIGPLPMDEAILLLNAWGGQKASDREVCFQICDLIGCLPLAVRLIGHYILTRKESAISYLAWLRETPIHALDQGQHKHESVDLLLTRSISTLSEDARQVLLVIGIFAHEPLKTEWVSLILCRTEANLRGPFGELINYSLLLKEEDSIQFTHALIHTYVRERLIPKLNVNILKNFLTRTILTLRDSFFKLIGENSTHITYLLRHIELVTDLILRQELNFEINHEISIFLEETGTYLSQEDRYSEAEIIFSRALLFQRRDEVENATLANLQTKLALIYRIQGRYQETIPYFHQALEIYEKVLTEDHPLLITALSNLALTYERQGNYKQAMLYIQRAFALEEILADNKTEEVASALYNLALLHEKRGNLSKAIESAEKCLKIEEKIQEPTSHKIIAVLSTLGLLYEREGRYREGTTLCKRALDLIENGVVTSSLEIARIIHNYAFLQQKMGNYTEAEVQYKRSIFIKNMILGSVNLPCAFSWYNLALIYSKQKKYGESISLYRQVLEIFVKVLGPAHVNIAVVQAQLSAVFTLEEKYSEAERLLKLALAILDNCGEIDSYRVGEVLNSKALWHFKQMDFVQAISIYEQVLVILQKVFGSEHPEIAETFSKLGDVYNCQGNKEQAQIFYLKAIDIWRKFLEYDHPDVLAIMENLRDNPSIRNSENSGQRKIF